MFSFFKKKPKLGEPAADVRPRSAREWLNADVGELLFGAKPARGDATADVEAKPLGVAKAPAVAKAPEIARPPEVARPSEVTIAVKAAMTPDAVRPQPSARPAEAVSASPAASRPDDAGMQPAAEPATTDKPAEDRSSWLIKLKGGLRRTGSTIAGAFIGAEIGDALYDELEVALLQADAGADATNLLLDELQARVTRADVRDPAAARRLLARCVEELLAPLEKPLVIGAHEPTVIMVAGVNGAGKTTSVGKLARHLMDAEQKVLLAAADTFRAAAREQLLAWAERAGDVRGAGSIDIVSQAGGDPAGVSFDAVKAGKSRGADVVIVDTAGRLATQANLMEELKKIRRTVAKAEPGAPHEVLLVIDGNTGQNALAQVQAFDAALQLTGLVITKLDGTAKGGVLAAIALWSRSRAVPLPVYFVGVGEKLTDLQTFRAREFAEALVA